MSAYVHMWTDFCNLTSQRFASASQGHRSSLSGIRRARVMYHCFAAIVLLALAALTIWYPTFGSSWPWWLIPLSICPAALFGVVFLLLQQQMAIITDNNGLSSMIRGRLKFIAFSSVLWVICHLAILAIYFCFQGELGTSSIATTWTAGLSVIQLTLTFAHSVLVQNEASTTAGELDKVEVLLLG